MPALPSLSFPNPTILSPEPCVSTLDSPNTKRSKRTYKQRRVQNHPLTAKQQSFINSLISGVDRVTAAKEAGYAVKNIEQVAWKLCRHPKIKAALSLSAEKTAREALISPSYVIEGIRAEIEHLQADSERSAAASQAIFRGQELLGKTIALFRDRVEEDRRITVTIERIG